MKTINLNSLVLKNYRSYKNETVVFSQSIGLKLLGGKNNVDIKLGANGSGKSSLWDAVCWCLYGTGIKGSKISSLVSWGEKEAEVTTILSIDGVENHITRTGPPVKIKINDEVATQEQLDQLIGLPKHRFLNSVIFGQGVPLFPDLSTPERGQLLDEVLSLEIWNRCSDNATKKATQLESNLLTARINIASVQGKIEGLSTEEQIVAEIIKWDAERVSTIDNLKKQKADWKESIIKQAEVKDKDLAKLETEINAVVDILADETTGEADQIGELDSIIEVTTKQYKDAQEHFYKAKTTVDSLAESAGFWENDICPVCLRPITERMKETNLLSILTTREMAAKDRDLFAALSKVADEQLVENKKIRFRVQNELIKKEEKKKIAERDYYDLELRIKLLKKEGETLVEQLETDSDTYSVQIVQLQNKVNPYITLLNENIQRRATLWKERAEYKQQLEDVETSQVAVDFWKTGFKRIRLYFVQQILSSLEIEIGSAISALGLEGWSIKLSTETETKSGTLKLGIALQVTSPTTTTTWEAFSGGETQRLRLAVAHGLSSLIQRAAGVWYSFEAWDEPTNWLSTEGIEDLLEALSYKAQSQKKQIWIVDHRALTYSGFQEIWMAIKGDSGTKVTMVNESED